MLNDKNISGNRRMIFDTIYAKNDGRSNQIVKNVRYDARM